MRAVRAVRGSATGVALVAAGLLATSACTGGAAAPSAGAEDDDVAVLRLEPPPAEDGPGPREPRDWPAAPIGDDAEPVLRALTEEYPLPFSQESAGIYPGTRWSATTGQAVEPGDVERTASVLVDREGRLRTLTCNVVGPIRPDDTMLLRCAELAGLPDDALDWVDSELRQEGAGTSRTRERRSGGALARVTTAGPWAQRSASLQVTGGVT